MFRLVAVIVCCVAVVEARKVSPSECASMTKTSDSWQCDDRTITVTEEPFASGHSGTVPISKGVASESQQEEHNERSRKMPQDVVWKEAAGTCIECAATRWANRIGATSMDCVAWCDKGIALTVVTDSKGAHCPTVQDLLKEAAGAAGALTWVDMELKVTKEQFQEFITNVETAKALDDATGLYTSQVLMIEGFADGFAEKAKGMGLATGHKLVSVNGLALDDNEGLGKLMSTAVSAETEFPLLFQHANLDTKVGEVIDLVERVMREFVEKYEPFLDGGVINTDQSAANVLACDYSDEDAANLVFIDFGLDGLRMAQNQGIPSEIQEVIYGSMVGMLFCNHKLDYPPQICKAAKKVAGTRTDNIVASLKSEAAQDSAKAGLQAFAKVQSANDLMAMFALADSLTSSNGTSVSAQNLLSLEALSECR